MNASFLRNFFLLCWLVPAAAYGQTPAMKLKLQLISDNTWGVYVKPEADITTGQTITIGGDQVTVVMPKSFGWDSLVNVHGNWVINSQIYAPVENPTKAYISFGFISEAPPIPYQKDVATLLFTFKGNGSCPDTMYIMDNYTDPFNVLPNSVGNNPGNEFAVFDMTNINTFIYHDDYAPSAWSCHDNDGDGILNALEDTNGNGVFDPGVDISDLKSVCSLAFTLDPKDATVCSGNDTTFTATASIPQGVFSFEWMYSDDNGATWVDIDFTTMSAIYAHTITGQVTAGTDILTVKNVASQYGRRFRAVAHSQGCNAVYSNFAILSVQGPLSVNTNPVSVTVCAGYPTTFSGSFYNPGVPGSTIYRWQVSYDGGATWVDILNNIPYNGSGNHTLSITNVAGLHGYQYRLSARTSTCNIMYSAPASLTVEGPITVTAQPQTVDLCAGEPASFTSTANVGTVGTLVYQWQVSSDNTTWSDIDAITDGGVYSGETTTTLNVSNTTGLYSRSYRLAFSTAECGRVYSYPAGMNIDGPISITGHPDDILQCSGEGVIFGAKAQTLSLETNNTGLIQYQWQESTGDTMNDWRDLYPDTLYNGTHTDTLSIGYTTNLDGNYYRMKIWTDNCDTVYSYAALLDVEGPMMVTQEPYSIIQCSGSGTTFHAEVLLQNGDPNTLIYQWEVSQFVPGSGPGTGYQPYVNVTNSGVYSGATSTTLTISDVAGMHNWRYRMRYRTPNCNPQWTNYAYLGVEGPIGFAVGGHPVDVVECSGNAAIFQVTTTNNNPGIAIAYQWQILFPGLDSTVAQNWANLNNGTFYNGVKTANLSISNIAGFNGNRYRVLIQTQNCSSAVSYSGLLTVEGPITITQQPQDTDSCNGASVFFHAEAAVANAGTLKYQWQWSDNATGVNFSNITTAGVNGISGWDTPTLNIENTAGIIGRHFRVGTVTNECNFFYSTAAVLTSSNCLPACIRLKLQLLPDSSGWAVIAKPQNGYVPSATNMVQTGKVTIVTPVNFILSGLENGLGQWNLTNVVTSPAGHPNRRYLTIDLMSNANNLGLSAGETKLFQFDKTGACPDSLYLLETTIAGVSPNELIGQDNSFTGGFEYCGVYARKAWRCQGASSPGGPIIFGTEEEFTGSPQAGTDKFNTDFPEGKKPKSQEGQSFTLAPNPAGDFVNILVSANLAEDRKTIALWDLQGKKHQEIILGNTATKLDLAKLPAGVYFVSLAQNGRVVERKKLVVK